MRQNFPNARLSGCQFHLSQAILRKLGVLGLMTLYKTSHLLKKYVRALNCLAFVNELEIVDTFNQIYQQQDFPECLIPLYNYFKDNYINGLENALFPPSLWNLADERFFNFIRSNNCMEGFNRTFQDYFHNCHHSFTALLCNLRQDEFNNRVLEMKNSG